MTHLQKFQEKLRGIAPAALISREQNRFYLCSFPYSDGYLLILPEHAYLITDFRYEEAARREASREFEVLSPTAGIFACIAELLCDRSVEAAMETASEAAAWCVRRSGAAASIPWRSELFGQDR